MINQRGIVYTFYSFKGGVGRSMALANVAALLAKKGKRVMIIDWDLEAPGLEEYFTEYLDSKRKQVPGVVDLVTAFSKGKRIDWHSCLRQALPFREGLPISIFGAGGRNKDYVSRLQKINWEQLFNEQGFGEYLEQLREEWIGEFDFVLVDSRTGITDIGGICTIHLPDILVLLFTANEQSVAGVAEVMRRARERYKTLPFDRAKLLAVPVPSRFENTTEHNLAKEWKGKFTTRLRDIYHDWLPDKTTSGDILEKLFIPYVPFWSFGEGLPVVKEGTSDPRSIGFAYELLTNLLNNNLKWEESLQGDMALSNDRSPDLISEDADNIYYALDDQEQEIAKRIILRLVRIARPSESEDTKRKVFFREFDPDEIWVIGKLVKNRILFEGFDGLTKELTIEIAQEALVKNWRRLREWIEDDREFLFWRQDLESKKLEWEDNPWDISLLLTGSNLSRAEKILNVRSEDLSFAEKEFIIHSAKEIRLRENIEKRRRLFSYLPYLFAALSVATVITISYMNYVQQRQQESQLQQQLEQQNQQQKQLEDFLAEQKARSDDLARQNAQLQETLFQLRNKNGK